jgi:hypothetical protein
MRVHAKFTLRNLKDVPLKMAVRVQKKDGDILASRTSAYRNQGNQLEASKPLKPGFVNAVYKDYNVFIPYDEFVIGPGKHKLDLDADIYYGDGELLKHLALHPFAFTQPARSKPTAKFDRMWIDYDVTQNGKKGMMVHTKFTIDNLLNQTVTLALGIEKETGTKVFARTTSKYRSKTGQLAFYKTFTPKYNSAKFNDVKIFVPYAEIPLPVGKHKLRFHADILQTGTNLNIHLNYYSFAFNRRRTPR